MSSAFPARGQDPAVWAAAAVPGPLMRALDQRGGLPHTVRQDIARQLAEGTPATRLRDRMERRWWERYAQLTAPELLQRADDIALDLVAAPTCPLGCEDGWLPDESRVCPWCRPNNTVIDVAPDEEPAGRRLEPEEQARRAAEVRAAMRAGRRYPRPAR
ncbi:MULTISPECIES: hypothetical protein [Kitasatospora]|uniref:Cysteine-rich CPCC domain-containing protein n=1 Tax=Kitasatospora arboriphila TaxID=258052 RepID=A0ABP4DVU2_9ACTN